MNADEGAQSQFQAPRMGLEPKKQDRPSKKEWRSMNADGGAQSQFPAPTMGLEPKKQGRPSKKEIEINER